MNSTTCAFNFDPFTFEVGFENKYKKLNKKQKQLKMRTRNEGGRINTRRDSVVCNNKQLQILKLFFYSKKYFIHLKISVF